MKNQQQGKDNHYFPAFLPISANFREDKHVSSLQIHPV